METYIIFVFSIFGLIIGSFINVLIYRIPNGISIIKPSSHCPSCGEPIKPWRNIPIVSFLLLRGKCPDCAARISWRYPLAELATALWFALAAFYNTILQEAVFGAVFGAVLITLSIIDLEHRILPDKIVLPSAIMFLSARAFFHFDQALIYLLSGIGAFALMILINMFSMLVFKKEGILGGDIKLSGCLGFALGPVVFIAILFAFLSGAIVGITVMAINEQIRENGYIPFGPFLAAGGILAYLYGNTLISWYLNFLVVS